MAGWWLECRPCSKTNAIQGIIGDYGNTVPFSLLEGLLQNLPFADLPPPAWVVDEVQRRIVLLLNHILLQEPQATSRLTRQKGRVVQLQWRSFSMRLVATAAGLLDLAPTDAQADLVLSLIHI